MSPLPGLSVRGIEGATEMGAVLRAAKGRLGSDEFPRESMSLSVCVTDGLPGEGTFLQDLKGKGRVNRGEVWMRAGS